MASKDDSGRSQINFTCDRDAKELAKDKLDHGELSAELRQTVQRLAFGEEISQRETTKRRLAELRDEKDTLRSEKREIEAQLEDVEQEITRVEERLDKMERKEDKYEASLEMLEESLRNGQRVFEDHGQVIKAAKVGGKDAADVLDELRERNPDIPEQAFHTKLQDRREWNGVRCID